MPETGDGIAADAWGRVKRPVGTVGAGKPVRGRVTVKVLAHFRRNF